MFCLSARIVVNIVDTLKSVWYALQAFGGMFCLSGLLGMYGSCVTLAGFCMARHFATSGISVFKIKVSAAQVPWYKAWTCCTKILIANTCMALFLKRHNNGSKRSRHVNECCSEARILLLQLQDCDLVHIQAICQQYMREREACFV